MKMSINCQPLARYVERQLSLFFPDDNLKSDPLPRYMDLTIQRVEYCFSKVNSKYFFDGKNATFNHLNGDQYAMFLYILANTLYHQDGDINLCTKVFQLNRYLHGIDVYYEVELPDIFLFVHSSGTVLGRARYSNYFIAYQGCNVGGSPDHQGRLAYPILEQYVTMHPGSSILGDCTVGENTAFAAGSLLLNRNIGPNSLYIGNPRDYTIRSKTESHYIWR